MESLVANLLQELASTSSRHYWPGNVQCMALYTHTSHVALVLCAYVHTVIALTYTCRAVADGELHRALREKFLGLYII